jgi:hypothetical protein
MKRIAAPQLLSLFAFCALVCLGFVLAGPGALAIWAVALLGFFHSIMFPTIFALSIKNLGRFTKLGSSLLVASIIGGAVVPAMMGFISTIADPVAFVVPLICQAYVLYFRLSGYKPVRTVASVAVGCFGLESLRRAFKDFNEPRFCFTLDLKDNPARIAEYRSSTKIWPEISTALECRH